MGLFRDIIDGINSLANYKKADADQIKAKTDKDKMKILRKQNRELKKHLSKHQMISLIGILIGVIGIMITVYFVYFPIHH